MTYDLPAGMIEGIERVAKAESIPQSDVVAWAVAELLQRYNAGQVDWQHDKRTARSLRWSWRLVLPEPWEPPA